MKKSELIKILDKFDDDIEILVQGYEDGYDDIDDNIIIESVYSVEDGNWWNGDFASAIDASYYPELAEYINEKKFPAVVLLRNNSKKVW